MTVNGSELIQPLTLDYGAGNSWGDFEISPAGTFPIGDYVATLTYVPERRGRDDPVQGQVTPS